MPKRTLLPYHTKLAKKPCHALPDCTPQNIGLLGSRSKCAMTKMAFAPMTYAPSAKAQNPRTNKNIRIIKELAGNANRTIKTKGVENCTYSSTNWSINTVVQYLKHTLFIK